MVAEHVRRYIESDGREGFRWEGAPCLILTTRGRKSGELYRTALIFGRSGDDYIVVASRGGSDRHPAWYLNLQQQSDVYVQVKDRKFEARARTAEQDEKPALWAVMTDIWPDYDDYQARTEREIPVVILQPWKAGEVVKKPI